MCNASRQPSLGPGPGYTLTRLVFAIADRRRDTGAKSAERPLTQDRIRHLHALVERSHCSLAASLQWQKA